MAYYRQRPGGVWQAQVFRHGIRRSETFPTKASAEKWANETEAGIVQTVLGKHEPIRLEPEELTRIFAKAKENAKQRQLDFEIRRDDVVMLYGRSGGICEVTGIRFNRYRPENSSKRPWFPSLDRIDSHKSYTIDNCRMVCVAANFAMGEWGEWVLKAMSRAVCYGRPGLLTNGPMPDPRTNLQAAETII